MDRSRTAQKVAVRTAASRDKTEGTVGWQDLDNPWPFHISDADAGCTAELTVTIIP
jgi:hypothetical protein